MQFKAITILMKFQILRQWYCHSFNRSIDIQIHIVTAFQSFNETKKSLHKMCWLASAKRVRAIFLVFVFKNLVEDVLSISPQFLWFDLCLFGFGFEFEVWWMESHFRWICTEINKYFLHGVRVYIYLYPICTIDGKFDDWIAQISSQLSARLKFGVYPKSLFFLSSALLSFFLMN